MKTSISWLSECLGVRLSVGEVCDTLTLAGLEVEGVEEMDGDTILDISLTPNLGHCLSVRGIARELAAFLNLSLKNERFDVVESGQPIEELIAIQWLDRKHCLRYACRAVMNIEIAPSPQWLQKKLEGCGLRTINNVVDIGNYILLKTGQPLHLFDLDQIAGHTLIIHQGSRFPTMRALNEKEYDIPPDALIISDAEKPVDFAGVIGSLDTAIHPHTKHVLIEGAYFSPSSVRKTSRLLHLKTDASQRFERGVDPNAILDAIDEAAFLLQTVAQGSVAKGVIDLKNHPFVEKKIACRPSKVNQLLGVVLSNREIALFLTRLGMTLLEESEHQLLFSIPTYRHDLQQEVDLIEEIARLYGYPHFPKITPEHITSSLPSTPLYELETKAKELLIGQGFQQMITCDLLHPDQALLSLENAMGKDALISVLQPQSIDQSVLRASLLPGLLQVVKYNCDRGSTDIAGFEVGRIHFKEGEHYFEPSCIGMIWTGHATPYHFDPKPRLADFFDLKGVVENFFHGFHIEPIDFEISHLHNFHPGRQARMKKSEVGVGVIGEVHPDHLEKIGIFQKVYYAEINLNALIPFLPTNHHLITPSPFPGSKRDWTLTLDERSAVGPILTMISTLSFPFLQKVLLLDLYKSSKIGKDKKNITLRFFYGDPERTISDEIVESEHEKLIAEISSKLNMRS